MKVRHPGASSLLELDFVIMLAIARVAACIPGLRDVRLEDSLRQFGIPLRQQLDLQLEAQHLDLFSHNFRYVLACIFERVPVHTVFVPRIASIARLLVSAWQWCWRVCHLACAISQLH